LANDPLLARDVRVVDRRLDRIVEQALELRRTGIDAGVDDELGEADQALPRLARGIVPVLERPDGQRVRAPAGDTALLHRRVRRAQLFGVARTDEVPARDGIEPPRPVRLDLPRERPAPQAKLPAREPRE